MRRWANRKKSAWYKHIVEKSIEKREEIADQKFEKYYAKVKECIESAAEKGLFYTHVYMKDTINYVAYNEVIEDLRDNGFSVRKDYAEWSGLEFLTIRWRKLWKRKI